MSKHVNHVKQHLKSHENIMCKSGDVITRHHVPFADVTPLRRCLALIYPLRFGRMRLKTARAIVAVGWSVCLFLSLLPLSKANMFGDAFYGRTGACARHPSPYT